MLKCCVMCARLGTRGFVPAPATGRPLCRHRGACQRRAEFVGKWIGAKYLQRRDHGGAFWQIRPQATGGFELSCSYRDIRTISWHPTVDLAKKHRDDVVASWQARNMSEYQQARSPGVNR